VFIPLFTITNTLAGARLGIILFITKLSVNNSRDVTRRQVSLSIALETPTPTHVA